MGQSARRAKARREVGRSRTWNIVRMAERIVGFSSGRSCIFVYSAQRKGVRKDGDDKVHAPNRTKRERRTLIQSAGLVANVASVAADIPDKV